MFVAATRQISRKYTKPGVLLFAGVEKSAIGEAERTGRAGTGCATGDNDEPAAAETAVHTACIILILVPHLYAAVDKRGEKKYENLW